MSATALQRAYQKIAQSNANRGGAPTLSPAASLYAKDKDEEEKKKNRGGLLGGLGYVGEKLGLGLLQGIEGVWDYAAGGIADLFGADAWAERQFSSDWLNYNHADDWYNPGEGWKVAGDVTGGIGTSLPGILTAAGITLATGGSGAAAGVGLAVGSLSAAGTSTKEAMQESGELTGKEYLYGAGMGAVEAVTEKLSGGLGAGVTKAAKSIGKAFGKVAAKETAEAAAKSAAKKGVALSLKTVAKSARREFLSEAFEEGFSEWVAPYIARATYDPNAQNATAEEVFYSALVGGLSGVGTAGGVGAFVQHKNVKSGTEIASEGRAKQILSLAKRYTEEGFSNTEDAQGIREIYEKLAPAVERGEALSKEQRRMLGELNSFEIAEQLRPTLQRSALTAVNGADAIAERLNADGRYKMVNDKFTYVDSEQSVPEGATVRDITAEDITKGYDPSKKNSIKEAVKSNDVLRYIAASDAAGRFIMTAKDFEKAALSGQKIQSQADLNLFIENASAEQKAAVGRELGVTDWNTLNIEGFNERAAAYRESGKAEAYKQKTAKIEKMKQLADSKPKSIPRAITLADGDVKHYADADSNIAIARTGDTFLVYDYKTGNVTRDMTRAEVNAELARYRQSKSASAVQPNATTEITNTPSETANSTTEKTTENFSSDAEIEIKDEKISKTAFENEFSEEKSRPTVKEIKAANEAKEQAKRFDALAKEKIKDYDGLSEANKSMIRKIFREAEANGISEADTLSYARVSARTGLDIVFDKKACYKGKNEAGDDVYHAGFYDPENNRIVVNPETKKKHTVLLIHELSHAMRSYRKNGEVKYFIDADAKVSEKMWKEIRKYYADENGNVDEGLTLDEASAYYAEAIFGTEGAIDLLLGEKPTLKQKLLSFFTKSAAYYSTDEKLSKEARRHFRKFKAMFDAFTARNYGRNAETGLAGDKTDGRRYSFSSIAFSFHGVDNMTAAEFEAKDYKKTEGYKAYVEECLNNMRQTQKGFDEKAARKQIEKSIDGIVSVAVAMKKAGYDIADTAEQRSAKDTKQRLLFSSLEPNSDYFTSSDISTICDKRKNFAEIYDDIVRAEEAKGVPEGKRFFDNVDNYFYIHKVLADKGLTQPCRQCYVESMRKNLAPMANAFLTLVQEADGNNTKNPQLYDKGKIKANNADTREAVRKILDGYGFSPKNLTVEMLTTEDGLAQMKITMPELYERFNSFYGQSKPKMPKGATPFRFGELTALLTDNHGKIKESLVKKINSTGGFRLQSYSDFQIQNYADVLQVIFEAGTLGLHGHAYTKVPAFIDATANTNLKRNMSIFMYNDNGQWKIDRNDSFPYTLEQIYELEKADESGNTGIIAVVQNEDMASWVMANDNVGYFIPFHKSGIKMGVVRETIVKEDGREIKGYKDIKDHTRQQTEVWAKTIGENKANTKVSKPINIYDFWDFNNAEKLSQKKLIEKNLKRYIDECEKRGYLPKFREYVMGNDKVLKNVLKYAKELGMVSESATLSDISFEYKGYTIPYGYYKCLGDFSMFKPDGTASPIQPLSLENYDFAKAVKLFSDAESVRRNEILQQFANGTEREYYRNSTMTAEELQKVIDTKRTEVVNEIVGKPSAENSSKKSSESGKRASMDSDYMSAVNRGDMVTAQRMVEEAAREAGYNSPKLYHGTKMFGFTEVRTSGVEKDVAWSPFFAANKEDISASYVPYGKVRDISSTMDEDAIEEARENAIEERKENIADLVDDFRSLIDRYFSERVFGQTDNSYLEGLVEKANPEAGNGDGVYDVLSDIVYDAFYDYQDNFQEYEDLDDWSENSLEGQKIFSKIVEIEGEKSALHRLESGEELGGIYQLYANLDNMYVMDGKGAAWNELRPEGLPKIERGVFKDVPYKTRDVAEWAKDNGFDGVIFKNIKDNGAYGRTPAGDVYAFFRPESQVKSADPVTYDDNGNVIPLSERFNPKKSDIRYSSETIENVGKSRFDEPDVKFREKIKAGFVSAKDKLYIEAVDELYGVEKYLTKFGGRKDAESFVQQVRASETISQTMIGVAQYDITNDNGKRLGDGLTKIFKKYNVRGISDDFDDYLLHQLNVDRMTLNERSLAWKEELRLEYEKAQKAYDKAKKLVEEKKKKSVPRKIGTALTAARNAYESFEVLENKPVFGENETREKAITAEESKKIIAEYEAKHPEFKDSAEEVWAYSKNLQSMRVSSGLISQESADIMAKYYPHYVPSFRDKTKSVGAGTVKNASQLAVNSTIKKAKGGGEDIYSVEESLAAQTRQTVKAMQINRMANAVYEAAISSGDTSYVMTKEAEKQMKNTDPDADYVIDLVAKNNQIVFFRDGKKMEMNVAQEIFDGFKGVTSGSVPDSLFVRMSSKVLGGFKNLVTQLSPAFAVRNFVRDLQDAIINTKHPRKFIKQLKGALSDMATNGNEWQLYLAYGGFASTVFDAKGFTHGVGERGFEAFRQISGIDESSFKKIGKGLKNVLTVVGNANAFIEQLTRFMEFKASLAAGDSIQTAINNSAEVTTNFSRHGKVVKVLNATFIPFLNASVQGFDKLMRVISGPFKEQSLAAIAILFAKILAIGIAPQILNMLMYGDEEDYEDLTNEVRENYFLIKVGEQYIKIPRGRAAGAFGGIANRIGNVTRGDSFDLPGYLESLKNNVTPVDSFSRTIFAPINDVRTNTTWYGGEIEGRQFENVRPSQRYDESTSSIAIALGSVFNYSPKKIHYLLDQYSGVIGDFLLPVTTKKAEKDYLSANFLIDPKTNNKLSDEFYKLYDEAQFAKNEGDETAYYQMRHLNDVKDSVSKLYDEIESIQRSDKKNAEKLNEVRTIRTLINNLYKTAKTDYAAYAKAIETTEGLFDETTESGKRLRYTVITQMMYGSEKALEEYNSDVYEKSRLFNKAGMSYDTFYEYYFTTKFIEADTDRKGEKIEGSKRKNTIAAINKLNATREDKLLMIVSSGYALKDGDIRGISAANAKRMLLKYILSMKGTQAEKAALAEACGFEVKNGKILKNFL
jgi:hypothetical protein